MEEITIYRGEFCISTNKEKLDVDAIHDFLSTKAYWCLNIPKDKVQTSIHNSLCFGVYEDKKQIGFARVITDFATIAYLGDIYILEEYRGFGLSKWLMEIVMNHQDLQELRRWILLTGTTLMNYIGNLDGRIFRTQLNGWNFTTKMSIRNRNTDGLPLCWIQNYVADIGGDIGQTSRIGT